MRKGAVQTVSAHSKKINSALFTRDNSRMLTAGRDSTLRMWDTRTYYGGMQNDYSQTIDEFQLLQEYGAHKCQDYNISSSLFGNEQFILTGSEDRQAYIYDVQTGEVINTLVGHNHVVHLLDVQNDSTIATSSIDSVRLSRTHRGSFFETDFVIQCNIALWEPNLSDDTPVMQPQAGSSLHSAVVESLLQKYGEQILRVRQIGQNNVVH